MSNIVVIGAGPAGMMAAIVAAKAGHQVTLLEKNEKIGKKLFITGKGRCNVTNACEIEGLFSNVMEHDKFLYSAIYGFDNQSVMQFFENAGCKLKIERGQRVFPESDHSSDVIRALDSQLKLAGVNLLLNREVDSVLTQKLVDAEPEQGTVVEDSADKYKKKKSGKKKLKQTAVITGVKLKNKEVISADCVIVATGGISYVLTGSTGDGYQFAKDCGHSIAELSPALVPFQIKEEWCKELQGLSLRNVTATVEVEGKKIYSDFGEMLFTHYGVSGPLMLSASSYYVHKAKGKQAKLFIDLKPALTKEQLDKRILREFDENKNKQFKNAITSLFPAKLLPIMPLLAGINPDKKVHEITKEERERFVDVIKNLEMTISGIRDYNEAIVTKGGVNVSEVSPSTMESKLVKGLYFAGEVLDLDALTGGFNLQIAWSTGYLAGMSAAGVE
ncbi:MAG: NAD(P)/FAD-dependent oxidoreductase [Lachnospiraceae bacterium]|nr:NAD(P)/FAD-dependent oxidoreductase [Lachnospiraceae bacterium]